MSFAVTWLPELQCHAIAVRYDFAARTGHLFMAQGECCDMKGCLSLFGRLGDVGRVFTYQGAHPDTCYVKLPGGWAAMDYRQATTCAL